MSKINPWIIILIALAAGGFIWAINERSKKELAEEKFKQKDDDYLKLLHEYLNGKKNIPEEIKQQLVHLRDTYTGIDDNIAMELKSVVELIESNKEELAIQRLTTVIENLLKEKYVSEGKAKDKKSCPALFNLLEKALELKWITKHEFYVSLFLKDERNEATHELAIRFQTNWKFIAFLAGIELIYNLKGMKKSIQN